MFKIGAMSIIKVTTYEYLYSLHENFIYENNVKSQYQNVSVYIASASRIVKF